MTGTRRTTFGLGVVALVLGVLVTGCTGGAPEPPAPVAAGPTSGAPAPPPAGPAPAGDALGPDLVLPEEVGEETLAEYTDWSTDTAVGQAWLLDPCRPTDYPTDRQRVAFRTTSRTGPEVQDGRQLATYPSPEVAAEVLAGFRRALAACSTGTTPAGSRWQWTSQDVPDLGDDGLVAASTVGGEQFSPAGDRIAVTRVGAHVFLAHNGGEYGAAELDRGADAMRELARKFAERL